MRRTIVLLLFLCCPAAFGLNTRSAVSVSGADTNPCTMDSPCRSIAVAIASTAPSGEVIALDSAGYGPFAVLQPIAVIGAPGIHAAISVTTGDGISIDLTGQASSKVLIRNLSLIGAGGFNGIHDVFVKQLTVMGCEIRGFSFAGIMAGDSGAQIAIDDCRLLDNQTYGIQIAGNGQASQATISRCDVRGNATGIAIGDHTDAAIAASVVSDSPGTGILLSNTAAANSDTQVIVESSTIAHNGTGVVANASGGLNTAVVALSDVVLAFNATAASFIGNGSLGTFSNNRFSGNTAAGSPFVTVPLH